MSSSSVRAFPPAAALAIVGGAAGLLALLLPWFSFDPDGLMQLAKTIGIDRLVAQQQGSTPDQVQQILAAQLQDVETFGSDALLGYHLFSPISVAVQAIAAAGAIWAALRMAGGEQPGSVTGPLFAAALVVGGRAVYAYTRAPGAAEMKAAGVTVDVLNPAIGLWVAAGGAALLLAAALVATMHGSATTASEWIAPSGGVPGSAHVPTSMTTQTPGDLGTAPGYAASAAPTYAAPPAAATYAAPTYAAPPAAPAAGQTYAGAYVPQPAAYEPGMAYGDEGPSSLDGAKNAPRAADPYAPKRPVSPDAMPPAPPTVAPHQAPVAPLRTAPIEPQAPGAPRRSVAPPGVG